MCADSCADRMFLLPGPEVRVLQAKLICITNTATHGVGERPPIWVDASAPQGRQGRKSSLVGRGPLRRGMVGPRGDLQCLEQVGEHELGKAS